MYYFLCRNEKKFLDSFLPIFALLFYGLAMGMKGINGVVDAPIDLGNGVILGGITPETTFKLWVMYVVVLVEEIVERGNLNPRNVWVPGQEVMFITERAVFRLTADGVMLTEIAPGVDLQTHILDKMEFTPLISPELKEMDPRLFRTEKMKLTLQGGHTDAV